MTIVEFLLERIAEDEAVARDAAAVSSMRWIENDSLLMFRDPGNPEYAEALAIVENYRFNAAWAHVARQDPARVLAECEAKRRIVDYREQAVQASANTSLPIFEAQVSAYDAALRALAGAHADHPDFDPAWRVS